MRMRIGAVLTLSTVAGIVGCYSVPPYYAYPPMSPQQPLRMPPRATYVLPGDMSHPIPAGAITAPPTAVGSPVPSTPSNAAPGNDNLVPAPKDPSANGGKADRQSSMLDDPSQLRLARNDNEFDPPISDDSVFKEVEYQRPVATKRRPATTNAPTVVKTRPMESDIATIGYQEVSTGHHPSFAWIQGVLEYNPAMQSWHLKYDDNPGEDPNGGEFKLTGSLLSSFTRADHNKPFRIYGHIHDRLQDPLGKKQYVIEDAQRLD